MLQFHGKCTANPHVPLQPKACCTVIGPVSAAIQIHGLFFLAKEGKPLCGVPSKQRQGGFFFYFWLCRDHLSSEKCPGCILSALGMLWGPHRFSWTQGARRLGPCFKTPVLGFGMPQKQSGSVWLFSEPLAPPV